MCGACETLCPQGAIAIDRNRGETPTVAREFCTGCGWCVGQCPAAAIECIDAESGETVWNGYGTIRDWVR
jgi:MinD superfamily P-loop ATPase